MLMRSSFEKGDTIIEVLIAITIFSMVAFGTLTIMNQGTNAAQRALEISQVRMQIDSQAEALRAAQQAATKTQAGSLAWRQQIANPAESTTTPYDVEDENSCPETDGDIRSAFIMDTRNATYGATGDWYAEESNTSLPPFAQVDYSDGSVKSHGMWIERNHQSGGDFADRYDFVIRACWAGAGVSVPMQMQTVVRLYDPIER